MSDEELFAQLMEGSRSALTELAARYYGPLRAYFFRLMNGNLQDAEDLVQETFLRLMRYQGKLPQNFRIWIFTVARNLAYDRFRSAHYRHEQVGSEADLLERENAGEAGCDFENSDPAAEFEALEHISAEMVRSELNSLPQNQREVIILRFYHGLKLEEIAQITDSPLGTVKSRLFKGLQRFKQRLAEVAYEYN